MTALKKTVLVLGATGRQGGATARHLLSRGWRVRAFARDRNKPAAQALHQAGAAVVQGDYDDRASLEAAMQGVYGVFSVQASVDEVRQGQTIADAVSGWSPVISITRTPARCAAAIAAGTSLRNGSVSPSKPTHVSPVSASAALAGMVGTIFSATPITRNAVEANASFAARAAARAASLNVLCASTCSGAPRVTTR
jgi:NAD(P)-dependent dehydrogenase (short-subunit alcohol dehydrogenase family)